MLFIIPNFSQDYYPDCPVSFFAQYLTKGGWGMVLTADQQKSFKNGGYYTHKLKNGTTVSLWM